MSKRELEQELNGGFFGDFEGKEVKIHESQIDKVDIESLLQLDKRSYIKRVIDGWHIFTPL